jgi:parallel beta-helix repeat protein
VTITKNNITLESENHLQAIIQAPAALSSPGAIVEISGGKGVELEGFTIDGNGVDVNYGVRVDQGASAEISDNHITNIFNSTDSQSGVGILVGRANPSDTTTGTADIEDNTIDNYQKAGIVVANTGSKATIEDNTVTGLNGTGVAAETTQNGIQVSDGATGKVLDNTVSDNIFTGTGFADAGILVQFPGTNVVVDGNTVFQNQEGIYVANSSDVGSCFSRA